MRRRRALAVLTFAIAPVLAAGPLLAQNVVVAPPPARVTAVTVAVAGDDATKDPNQPQQSVYVRDSAAAADQMALATRPGLPPDKPAVTFRTALAYHLAGDATKANQFAAQLEKDSPDAVGTVAGKDTNLAGALKADLAQPPPVARGAQTAAAADSW